MNDDVKPGPASKMGLFVFLFGLAVMAIHELLSDDEDQAVNKTISITISFFPDTSEDQAMEITDLFSALFLREISTEMAITDLTEVIEDFEIKIN